MKQFYPNVPHVSNWPSRHSTLVKKWMMSMSVRSFLKAMAAANQILKSNDRTEPKVEIYRLKAVSYL